jgi:dihydrofolate reductase
MTKVKCGISMSLDGYVAGPEPSLEQPLGVGGEQLHEWVVKLAAWRRAHGREGGEETASSAVVERRLAGVGAHVMGRDMFGGGPGPWSEREPWNGWWGEEPPFHTPVFVLTHHPRKPLELRGTTFHFVTDGVEAALARAREAAGDRDVAVSGGADAIRQCLAAGLLDELQLDVVALLLGGGTRLFGELGAAPPQLDQTEVVSAPGVTHLIYRVTR